MTTANVKEFKKSDVKPACFSKIVMTSAGKAKGKCNICKVKNECMIKQNADKKIVPVKPAVVKPAVVKPAVVKPAVVKPAVVPAKGKRPVVQVSNKPETIKPEKVVKTEIDTWAVYVEMFKKNALKKDIIEKMIADGETSKNAIRLFSNFNQIFKIIASPDKKDSCTHLTVRHYFFAGPALSAECKAKTSHRVIARIFKNY